MCNFTAEQKRRAHMPQVLNLRTRAERVRQAELERILGSLNGLAERGELSVQNTQELIAQLSQRLTNKLLHEPTVGVQSTDEQLRNAWQLVSKNWLNDYEL